MRHFELNIAKGLQQNYAEAHVYHRQDAHIDRVDQALDEASPPRRHQPLLHHN